MLAIVQTIICAFLLIIVPATNIKAQNADPQYWEVVKARAGKILAPLGISDSAKFYRVRDKIAQEYVDIKKIDDEKEKDTKAVKAKNLDKAATDSEVSKILQLSENKRNALNAQFVQSLSKDLNKEQIEQVKNGMTYNVLPITYKGYLEMIPRLTAEEKKYIYDALIEAREHAMAAGSSEAKHGWFGKYKGRINNYLSSHGYDMNKESKAWQERIKAAKGK